MKKIISIIPIALLLFSAAPVFAQVNITGNPSPATWGTSEIDYSSCNSSANFLFIFPDPALYPNATTSAGFGALARCNSGGLLIVATTTHIPNNDGWGDLHLISAAFATSTFFPQNIAVVENTGSTSCKGKTLTQCLAASGFVSSTTIAIAGLTVPPPPPLPASPSMLASARPGDLALPSSSAYDLAASVSNVVGDVGLLSIIILAMAITFFFWFTKEAIALSRQKK